MARRRKDVLGDIRSKQWFYGTGRELRIVNAFLARARAREAEVSVLALMRGAGVAIELDPNGQDLLVEGYNPTQLEQIKGNKELIISALRAEKFGGPTFYDSAVWGEILAFNREMGEAYDQISDPELRTRVRALDAQLTAFLEELDEVGYLSLPEAIAAWARRRPEMAGVLNRIKAEREGGKAPAVLDVEAFR